MDIEGRCYHLVASKANHAALKRALKKLLRLIVAETAEADNDVAIGKLKLERNRNPLNTLSCVTLTNVDIDREVLDALATSLEALLKTPVLLLTNAGGASLVVSDDYQARLNAAVAQ